MSFDYSEFSKFLSSSLKEQNEIFSKQLILNPVENIPNPKYLSCCTSFLHGIYNSDKLRSENEMKNTKIQFANRNSIASDINQIYNVWCSILKAKAVSMRFFSGLHAHTTVFMAITNINDSVVILPEKAGGHMATKAILERLGLKVYELEIDYKSKRIDIPRSEQLIEKIQPKIIFIDRSEGTIYEDFSWISKYKDIYKIFDASQYLTNIIANDYISPFDMGFNAILSTTHKNFPGPQRALYCTKEKDAMWEKLYSKIGTYVSNMHPYSIYSLGLMLENFDMYKQLSHNMLANVKELKKELLKHQLNVCEQQPLSLSESITHHIWISCPNKESAFELYRRWERYGFLTNYRLLPYNLGYGIRIGLSAATVSGLLPKDIPEFANLLAQAYYSTEYDDKFHGLCEKFIKKIKERSYA
ncbi:hypothetical protein AALA13_01280 [Lachnospiraceae bacterium 50-23]